VPCALRAPQAASWAGERAHRRELLRVLGGDLALQAADAEGWRPVSRTASEPPGTADVEPRYTPRGTKTTGSSEAEAAAWRRIVWSHDAVREVSAEGLEEEVICEAGSDRPLSVRSAGLSNSGHHAANYGSSAPVPPTTCTFADFNLLSALNLNFLSINCIEGGLPTVEAPRRHPCKCSL